MKLDLDPASIESYRQFLAVKSLPRYQIKGRVAWFPDEYAKQIGVKVKRAKPVVYDPPAWMFDYQRDITSLAITKKKFAAFADCGLGKTAILLEFARHALRVTNRKVLIVSPLMVCEQTAAEHLRWYGEPLKAIRAANLQQWLDDGKAGIAITNYEAINDDIEARDLGGLILDESSMLKSHYGKWGGRLVRMGKGIPFKLCLTGTPAPNDRIEYANHAVLLDQFPTINAFLARYFVNRGQTDNRWELKPHALGPFYKSLSHWSIFLTNPATYGWKDNCETIPPIHTHIENVDLTEDQESLVRKHSGGGLFAASIGGIVGRSAIGQIAKGFYKGKQIATNKPGYIQSRIDSWPEESTILWCLYNEEQKTLAARMPDAANIDGTTPHEKRLELIADFKAGRRKVLISKGKILGFGLNLQVATRQVFSGLQDSYENFYQCVKRSNRYGSTKPLNVHIPVTDVEMPMIETVLRKAAMVQKDTEEQERIFKDAAAR